LIISGQKTQLDIADYGISKISSFACSIKISSYQIKGPLINKKDLRFRDLASSSRLGYPDPDFMSIP